MEAKTTQIKIINQARYSYDTIRLQNFDPKITRKQVLVKKIDDYEHICSVIAFFYRIVSFASEYVREWGRSKYLIFDNSFVINKNLLKNTQSFGIKLNPRLGKINEDKETDSRKDYIKIKFESDDDLPLNKPLIF